ncbi:hypothetical protein L7F22_059295 [Adiantum nelumboides]|nr:hypothetical protein [Adiantum nelumboides]
MGPDGQQINAPSIEAGTSQAEGEVHTEEAGASNQHGQYSIIAKERRKHRLVVYSSNSDDSNGNKADESDQGVETPLLLPSLAFPFCLHVEGDALLTATPLAFEGPHSGRTHTKEQSSATLLRGEREREQQQQ